NAPRLKQAFQKLRKRLAQIDVVRVWRAIVVRIFIKREDAVRAIAGVAMQLEKDMQVLGKHVRGGLHLAAPEHEVEGVTSLSEGRFQDAVEVCGDDRPAGQARQLLHRSPLLGNGK